MSIKIQAAQRLKIIAAQDPDPTQAGKLFLAVRKVFGKPTSQDEGTGNYLAGRSQYVTWKINTATIEIKLMKIGFVSIGFVWQPAKGRTAITGVAKNARAALKDLQNEIRQAMKRPSEAPQGSDIQVAEKLLALKV